MTKRTTMKTLVAALVLMASVAQAQDAYDSTGQEPQFVNTNYDAPWNNPALRDDPAAAWNIPGRSSGLEAAWNNVADTPIEYQNPVEYVGPEVPTND